MTTHGATFLVPPFVIDAELLKEVRANTAYRRVLYTDQKMQVVAMHVRATETIPREVHPRQMQVVTVVDGIAQITADVDGFGDFLRVFGWGDNCIIPPDTYHEIIPKGGTAVKLVSVYYPPVHGEGLVQQRQRPEIPATFVF